MTPLPRTTALMPPPPDGPDPAFRAPILRCRPADLFMPPARTLIAAPPFLYRVGAGARTRRAEAENEAEGKDEDETEEEVRDGEDGGDGGIRPRRLPLRPGPVPVLGRAAAEPGFTIERVRFLRPVPLEEGFRRIEAHLGTIGRPTTALCACEAPFAPAVQRGGLRRVQPELRPHPRTSVPRSTPPPSPPSTHSPARSPQGRERPWE